MALQPGWTATARFTGKERRKNMHIHPDIQYIAAIVAGVLALVAPRFLKYIVGICLVAYGVLGMIR